MRRLLPLLLLVGLAASSARSETMFNYLGNGLILESGNARAMGMGGVTEFALGGDAVAARNPAIGGLLNSSGGSLSFRAMFDTAEDPTGTFSKATQEFSDFALAIRLGRGFGLTAGIRGLTGTNYRFLWNDSLGDQHRLFGQGGLSVSRAAFAWGFRDIFTVGIGAHFIGGEIAEAHRVKYSETDSVNMVFRRSYQGNGFDFGATVHPLPWLYLAGSYAPEHGLAVDMQQTQSSDVWTKEDSRWPAGFSADLCAQPLPSLRIQAEYRVLQFSTIQPTGRDRGGWKDQSNLAGGVEWQEPEGDIWWQRLGKRLGGFYRQEYATIDGNAVTTLGGTLGLGIPLSGGVGSVDLALTIGRRGDVAKLGLQENLIQLNLSGTILDRWFTDIPR